jgi:ribose transport system substrate-binding protein
MPRRLPSALLALAALALTLLPVGARARPRVIGVSLLTLQQQFFIDLRAGLEAKAREFGWELVISSAELDPARQANQIDDLIARKVDVIVVAPCDSVGIGPSIEQANKAGIPVFTAEIASTSRLGRVVAHVAADDYAGGRRAGELMVRALGGQGDVAILTHPGISSVIDRVRGFKDVVASSPGIRILAEVPAWGQRARAASAMEELLTRLPELRGVFGVDDDAALGALAAVSEAGRARKVAIVGYGAALEARQAMRRGLVYGDTVLYPRDLGERTLVAVRDHLAGRTVPALVPMEIGVYTAAEAQRE